MSSSIIRAGIAFVLCIGAIVGYGMWFAAIEDTSAAVVGLQSQIDAKRETSGRISAARMAFSEISGDEAVVRGYFVPEAGVVAFIDDLEARGRAEKTVVGVLSVSKNTVKGARPSISFTISVEGTFDAVMRTMGSIEYAPYSLSLSSLSLGRNDTGVWRADSKLVVGSASLVAVASTTGSTNSPQPKP